MWTWRHPRLNRAWIIKKTEKKSAVVKVSRWDWNTLLKNHIFSSPHFGDPVADCQRDHNEGQFEGGSSNQPTCLPPSYAGDNILTLCSTKRWLCCLHVCLPTNIWTWAFLCELFYKGWRRAVLTIWCLCGVFLQAESNLQIYPKESLLVSRVCTPATKPRLSFRCGQFFINVYDQHVSLFEAVSSHQYFWL